MTLDEIFKVALAIITSLGGGAALVAVLSGWLGKLWADRLMLAEKGKIDITLERLRSDLSTQKEKELSELKSNLEIYKERLMLDEKAQIESALDQFRLDISRQNERELSELKSELEIYKEVTLKGFNDKIVIYRLVVDIISELLAELDFFKIHGELREGAIDRYYEFNKNRVKAYGYLAMLAPQSVMDSFYVLLDHLLLVTSGQRNYEWAEVREFAITLLNEVRKDIGLDVSPIAYKGKL